MPKSKNPNTRLKLMYEYICEGYEPGKRKILKHLNEHGIKVSEKTIVNDLNELKSRGLIYTSGAGRSVEYLPIDQYKSIEFEKDSLDSDDLFSLEMAYTILKQLKEFNLSDDLKSVIKKMHQTLQDKDYLNEEVIFFEQSNNTINTKLFQEIVSATKEKTVLKVNYKSFWNDKIIEKIIHPFFVKQYNKRWFLIGYNEVENRLDNSPIDRIKKIKPTLEKFKFEKFISHKNFDKNIVGVTLIDKPQVVELEFASTRAPYYLSKPFVTEFLSNKTMKNGNVRISHLLYLNNELTQQILSYGNDVTVIKPKALREEVKGILKIAWKKYE